MGSLVLLLSRFNVGPLKALSGFRFSRGLGHDFAGVVEAVGPGVERLKVAGSGSSSPAFDRRISRSAELP